MAAKPSKPQKTETQLSSADLNRLQANIKDLYKAVQNALQRHLFDSVGNLGSMRGIAIAKQQIVDLFLQRMRGEVSQDDLTDHVRSLVNDGLGQMATIDMLDSLLEACLTVLAQATAPIKKRLQDYRQFFLKQYMELRVNQIIREHESIHKSLQETLTKQVQQERQLRKKLEEEQELVLKRAVELETVAQVGASTTVILDQERLLQGVVDLTKQRFELYHTHIYLLNVANDTLVMAAGVGEAGRQMKAENHQIPLAEEHSLVVSAARMRQGVIVNDVQKSPDFLPNPLLPDTCSELAVPLIVGEQVLGVLDVQANHTDRFTDEDIKVFTILAAQVAIALQNARRYDEMQQALEKLTRLQRIMARDGWEEFLLAQKRPLRGFIFDGQEAKPVVDVSDEMIPTLETNGDKSEIETTDVDSSLSFPLDVHGEKIGQLGLRSLDGSPIPERKQALLQAIAQQVSEALERARLSEQTQQALAETSEQARRRALLNEVSEQLNRADSLDNVYQIIMEGTARIFSSDRVTLSILNEAGDQFVVTSLVGEGGAVSVGKWQPLAGTVSEKAIQTGTVLMMHDPEPRNGVASSLIAPLLTNIGAIGVLNVSSKGINVYDEADRDVILQIAAILSSVIESKRLFATAQRRAERESLINNINQRIQSAPTVQIALQTAVSELGQALKLKQALVELTAVKQENGHSG